MASGQVTQVLHCIRRIAETKALADLPDAELLTRFVRRGDEAAFGVLVERYGPLVLGLCRRIVHHEQDAEDAFQAVFLVLARKAGAIRKRESLGSWLYGVAYRIATKARQRTIRRLARETTLVDLPASEESPTWFWQDVRPVLDEEINRLPSRYRDAFVLCHLDGVTNEQAAARLGCPLGTVLSRLARARQRLRDRLTQRGLALPAVSALLLTADSSRAALPPALFAATTQGAFAFVATRSLPATPALALAQGALSTMALRKVVLVLSVLFVFGTLGTAGFLGYHPAQLEAAQPHEAPVPIPDDRLLEKVNSEWARVVERNQDGNPWADKVTFTGAYEDLKQTEPFKPEELKEAYDKLAKLAQEKQKDPNYSWRVQQLLGDLQWDLGNKDRAIEHSKKALEVYPAKRYAEPSKHSYFQHLANSTAGKIREAKGVDEAEKFILDLFQSSPKFQYFFTSYWDELYSKSGQNARSAAMLKKVADAYRTKMKKDPKNKATYELYLRQLSVDMAAMPVVEERKVNQDPKKTYYLLKSNHPADKKAKLLIILPGGHGQAKEFLPFLKDLFAELNGEYVFAVVSAPQWTKWQAENIVWPTHHDRIPQAEFTTEELITALFQDVTKAEPVNPKQSFLFGWSSSGPAIYCTALGEGTPAFTGYYVLASVFRKDWCPPLESAKAKRFYLQQGKEDKITAFRFATEAESELKRHGAAVQLEAFDGGHGFDMPNVAQGVLRALRWLEKGE